MPPKKNKIKIGDTFRFKAPWLNFAGKCTAIQKTPWSTDTVRYTVTLIEPGDSGWRKGRNDLAVTSEYDEHMTVVKTETEWAFIAKNGKQTTCKVTKR